MKMQEIEQRRCAGECILPIEHTQAIARDANIPICEVTVRDDERTVPIVQPADAFLHRALQQLRALLTESRPQPRQIFLHDSADRCGSKYAVLAIHGAKTPKEVGMRGGKCAGIGPTFHNALRKESATVACASFLQKLRHAFL